MTTTGRVKLYEGVIPKSGKAVFEFAGIKLVHRSVGKDKSDYIVHQDSGAVIMTPPLKTERSKVLDILAGKIDVLRDFVSSIESYELYESESSVKKVVEVELDYSSSMTHYSDGSCVMPSRRKKSFVVKDIKW
jgi:hypothetical protein